MKVPIEWLKEYIKTDATVDEIGSALTKIGHMQDGPAQQVGDDVILDLEVRQNRPDVLSIIGVARELAAVMKKNLILPESTDDLGTPQNKTKIIVDQNLCYRFHAITIENLEVKESPLWLQKRLTAAGVKSINNIVDITNFVALEWGMPLHAYDADKIIDRTITIRNAKKGEELVLFGGKKIVFDEDDLIHADASGPIGYGAIMGGAEKSVQNDTTAIILEAAVYNQASVRRGSIRHGLRSEASTRLEKFLDPRLVDVALYRALKLILEFADGHVADNTDFYPSQKLPETILVHFDEIERLGGVQIARDEIFAILKRLDLTPHNSTDKTFKIEIPFFRTDLEQEADIVEEVLRLYGYDNIPEKLLESSSPRNIQSRLYDFENTVRDILISAGFDEQITEPLTYEAQSDLLPIKLENSLSSDKRMLRTTLKNGLLKAFGERIKYRLNNIRLFELGQIYYEEDGSYKEQSTAGLLLSFERVNFFDAKGAIELLFEKLGRQNNSMLYTIDTFIYQNRTVYYAEVNLKDFFEEKKQNYYRVSTTPPQLVLHDFSFVVSMNTKVGEIIEAIYKTDPLVFNVSLGENPRSLENGKKSVFIKVSYYRENETLSEKEVALVREKVIKNVKKL